MIIDLKEKGAEDIFNGVASKAARKLCPQFLWRIASLALIGGPHGVKTEVASEMQRCVAQGEIPLIARDQDEFAA